MNSDQLLIVFTRNPEIGKVKTRLAKSIGNEAALTIYETLIDHTKNVVSTLDTDIAVYYSEEISEEDLWSHLNCSKHLQLGRDLGKRMQNAFMDAFEKGYQRVQLIGSDLFDLTSDLLMKGFEQLNNHTVVIGPAHDGGYYLIGLTKIPGGIFENKSWGTNSVFRETLTELKHETVFLLETLNDIDIYEDLQHHPNLMKLIKNNDPSH